MNSNVAADFEPGSLVSVRGREWVVLPESVPELLILRPVGGLDEETVGVIRQIEEVRSAQFSLPSPSDVNDFTSGRLLRDAARLSTRMAAGPFRSFGRIAVSPRPYQLVPLMMALKLDPVRMLIADDVGIGKTIEALMIARELLDRGEIQRLAVLCPPHLAEQWQCEMHDKFHIKAELVLSSTISRLERGLQVGESVFDKNKFTIVSTDFVKADRRSKDFLNKCPEFVIVDEAHGCTLGSGRGRQLRHELVKGVSKDPNRHLVLVTATPHTGNESAFRSLLSILDEDFEHFAPDETGRQPEKVRKRLARHLVQRRRGDIRKYLEEDTKFPSRKDREAHYEFSEKYKKLFEDIFSFAREYVSVEGQAKRRVRYWSALALLRCVSSSPRAAASTLRNRASKEEGEVTEKEADEVGRRAVLDLDGEDESTVDLTPGMDAEDDSSRSRRKMREFAKRAEEMEAKDDRKLIRATTEVADLINLDLNPIVFCRFIPTAEYVAEYFREQLSKKTKKAVRVECVTGNLPHAEREARIEKLATSHSPNEASPPRESRAISKDADEKDSYVLVCTDCLSEGINLQDHFDAVFHYDLAWNPTRHEQREGRVDRFGQSSERVRVVTYYGKNNPMDGVVLDVLIRKHKKIKSDLGVAVSVPTSSEEILETLFEGALLREKSGAKQLSLDMMLDKPTDDPGVQKVHSEWEDARDREKESRSLYAQKKTIKPKEVADELEATRKAIGDKEDARRFFCNLLQMANVPVRPDLKDPLVVTVSPSEETDRSLRQALGHGSKFSGRFEQPIGKGQVYLGRTSPEVEGLATWTLEDALDADSRPVGNKPAAARMGAIKTSSVDRRTTLLLVRFRYQIGRGGRKMLCEEVVPLAYHGRPDSLSWSSPEEGERLLAAHPDANLPPTLITQQLEFSRRDLPKVRHALRDVARARAQLQKEAHVRVRDAAKASRSVSVEAVLPVDILGCYVLLPSQPQPVS